MNRHAVKPVRISEVRTRQLSIPFERPPVTASFPIPAIDTVLVELRTDAGQRGVSWVFAFGEARVRSLRTLVDALGEVAIDHDVFETEALWRSMAKAVSFLGRRGAGAIAMSAIDTACWDVAGRCAGLPVYRMLGAARSSVEAYASEGLWLDRTRDELAEEARSYVERGFRGMKMRVGLDDADEDVARVAVVREAIGADVALMVDANQAWDVKRAIRMGRRLEELDIAWLEEPIPHEDVRGTARVAAALDVPLCTGESNYLKEDFVELIQAEAADILMPDLMRMGGVTEFLKVAHLCESFHRPITPHLFMEVSAHLAAACPNAIWQEHQPWWEPILSQGVELRDGEIRLSDRPGFGIELDEDAVRRFEVA